ncbi:uncharacterized protein A4U43_C05F14180 [Asparagus officinalis]|uniref:Uncharacterized protein n=1 Tax=Asparagus officinalis TaxID=4686 RepID=A0A5P1ES60_ASPOF|nr:uncharacterized protein A4U43_C05F14180 [Asparagus officinalis]
MATRGNNIMWERGFSVKCRRLGDLSLSRFRSSPGRVECGVRRRTATKVSGSQGEVGSEHGGDGLGGIGEFKGCLGGGRGAYRRHEQGREREGSGGWKGRGGWGEARAAAGGGQKSGVWALCSGTLWPAADRSRTIRAWLRREGGGGERDLGA